MNHQYRFITLLAAATLAACSTPAPRPLGPQALAALKGKSIAIANTATKPDFTVFTPVKAALGLLGEAAMRAEGNRIVAGNGIGDPSEAIARDLAEALNSSAGTKLAAASVPIASDDGSPSTLSPKAAGAGLVLYVQTQDWRTWYYTTNFNRYRARVLVSAQLIDTATQTVVAKAKCDEDSPKAADASPTYDEMLGSGAQRLKQELAKAQVACVTTLKRGLLGS